MDKSKFLSEEDERVCEMFKSKNPMNLKVHLKSTHRNANLLAYLEQVKGNAEPPPPETASPGGTTDNWTTRDEEPTAAFNQRDRQRNINANQHKKGEQDIFFHKTYSDLFESRP